MVSNIGLKSWSIAKKKNAGWHVIVVIGIVVVFNNKVNSSVLLDLIYRENFSRSISLTRTDKLIVANIHNFENFIHRITYTIDFSKSKHWRYSKNSLTMVKQRVYDCQIGRTCMTYVCIVWKFSKWQSISSMVFKPNYSSNFWRSRIITKDFHNPALWNSCQVCSDISRIKVKRLFSH